ncbi:MAG: GDSL family lipase [Bacteroidetes bacterium]|nr:GDSL family lipase [Bacteroidota bacterium]
MMRMLALLLCTVIGVVSGQTPYDSLYLKSAVYRNLVGQQALSRITSADIVFLGNSITYGGNWSELLGRERVVNRGIGGDNTVGMLHRLQYVYRLQPKLCFIMAGINDLYADAPVATIVANYTAIIDTLQAHRIAPVIQSTLYVNPKWKRAAEKNLQVTELNLRLKELAQQRGLVFIDVNAVLSSGGMLSEQYTTDGVHLTHEAYARWRELLLSFLSTARY